MSPMLLELQQLAAQEDLPTGLWSDEPEMDSDLHLAQIILLLQGLQWLWSDRDDYYVAGDMTLYYSPAMVKNREFRGPDVMVFRDVKNYPRRSWTLWEENWKVPNLIVEILSSSTAKVDRTTKKDLYRELGILEYFWFDPVTLEFAGHRLIDGEYGRLESDDRGYLWSAELGLWLGVYRRQLRYFQVDGSRVPTAPELAQQAQAQLEQAQTQVEQAQTQAQQAQAKADRLAARLRELGIDPDL